MIIITNLIIISCITQHAPLVKTKSTDPLVPLMKKLNITSLQLKVITTSISRARVQQKKTRKNLKTSEMK